VLVLSCARLIDYIPLYLGGNMRFASMTLAGLILVSCSRSPLEEWANVNAATGGAVGSVGTGGT
jgi:uncharacterized membrane protein